MAASCTSEGVIHLTYAAASVVLSNYCGERAWLGARAVRQRFSPPLPPLRPSPLPPSPLMSPSGTSCRGELRPVCVRACVGVWRKGDEEMRMLPGDVRDACCPVVRVCRRGGG